jgi:hypothetical protein
VDKASECERRIQRGDVEAEGSRNAGPVPRSPKVNGSLIAIISMRGEVAVRLAAYLLNGQDRDFSYKSIPGRCECGAENPLGLWISHHKEICCPACVPRSRRCAHCKKVRPIDEFRIIISRLKLESYCRGCEQDRNREYYHRAQKTKKREIPNRKKCVRCGKTKAASKYFRDARYADGLVPECIRCHTKRTGLARIVRGGGLRSSLSHR